MDSKIMSKTLILKRWRNVSVYTKQVKRNSWRYQFWRLSLSVSFKNGKKLLRNPYKIQISHVDANLLVTHESVTICSRVNVDDKNDDNKMICLFTFCAISCDIFSFLC